MTPIEAKVKARVAMEDTAEVPVDHLAGPEEGRPETQDEDQGATRPTEMIRADIMGEEETMSPKKKPEEEFKTAF